MLVVDDDITLAYLIVAVCRDLGFRCRMATSVHEARGALREEAFSLILCDGYLTDGSGLLLLDDLPDPPPPVVLCTGARQPPSDPRIDSVLKKPFQVRVLRDTVERWARKRV